MRGAGRRTIPTDTKTEPHIKGPQTGIPVWGPFYEKRNPPALLVEGKALAMNRNLLCYNETDLAVVQSNK